jgi:hypothetical protein
MPLIAQVKKLMARWSSPSLYASVLLLLTNFFYWDGMDLLTPFIFPFIAMTVAFVFICVMCCALVKACMVNTESLSERFRFVVLDLNVALTAMFFSFTDFRNVCDFNLNFNRRMEVVELARSDKLSRSHSYNQCVCALPPDLKYLSKGGGEVIVSRDSADTVHVLFYTYRGILSHYSGFQYSSDGKPPVDLDKRAEIVPLRKNWYWLAE